MDFLLIPSVGFLVLLLGTLFLVGEMLVRTKGVLGVIGLALVTSYFVFHISSENIFWILFLYISGLLFVFIDGKFINDGTIAVIGLIMMITAVIIPAPTIIYGVVSAFGLLMGAALAPLLLKKFPSRKMWSKMALKDRLTSEEGYNSVNSTFPALVGEKGKAITPFRPVGTIEINGKHFSAVTDGEWVDSGVDIIVVKVDGTKIVIKKVGE
ncbi:NfeD family protein [Bacillus sp. DJP31]|uniref:NfeD family protein n=1 Tax=Bacillus sp. DJP31 TaxID=3409789 RepID=UPI003BB4FAE8